MSRTVVCLGDSLTFGFGVPRREAWLTLAQKELGGAAFVNAGVPGDTTGGMLSRFSGLMEKHRPEALVLMGGSNDIFFGGDDGPARANIASMCHQAVSRNVRVVLCSPTPVRVESAREDWASLVDFFAAGEMGREYAGWLCDFAKTFALPFLDFFGEFERRGRDGEDLFVDGLHPNARGQGVMAGMFVEKLRELGF